MRPGSQRDGFQRLFGQFGVNLTLPQSANQTRLSTPGAISRHRARSRITVVSREALSETRMGLWRWIVGARTPGLDPRLAAWRASWNRAASSGEVAAVTVLSEQLNGLDLPEDDTEIEREMLGALEDLGGLIES